MRRRLIGAATVVVALAAVLTVGATAPAGAADEDTTVALFYDPLYTETCEDPGCEGWATRQFFEAEGATINLIEGITDTDFSDALDGANVLVIPELEVRGDLGPDMSAAARQVVADFVSSGGRVVMFGSSEVAPTLNTIFGFSLVEDSESLCVVEDPPAPPPDSTLCTETAAAAGTEFEGLGPLEYQDDTTGLVTASLPGGSILPFEDADQPEYAPVAVMPFGDGSIAYLGYDWFDGPPEGPQDGGWAAVLDAATDPVRVGLGAAVSGTAGDTITCDLTVGAGSQPVRVSWVGTFSDGGTFEGELTVAPDQPAAIEGVSTDPAGETAEVVITVLSPFGQVENDTCAFTWAAAPVTPLPVSAPATAAPVAVATPAFTG